MAKKQKPEDYIERFCAFCEYATPIPGGDGDVVCPKKGVVHADFVCRKFRYDPLKRNPKEKPALPDFQAISLEDD